MTEFLQENVPTLRFPEFSGEWKEKRLGNIFSIFNGYAFSSTSAKDNGAIWVKIADVGINEMKLDNPSFLPTEFLLKYKKFVLYEGDYVVALTRPILGGKLKISRISSSFNNSLLNQRVGKLVSNNSRGFIFSILQKPRLISHIENSIAGTDPPNLSPDSIRNVQVFIPKPKEQKKIASFLSAVADKIEQLTRKRELLELYKKGMMRKIFSQEFRFKDDNGNPFPDWEEKRLGEFTKKVSDSYNPVISKSDLECIELESLEQDTGRILKTFKANDLQSTKTKFKSGDVLFGKLRPYLRKYAHVEFDGVCTSEIWVLRAENISDTLLFYIVQTTRFNQYANIQSGSKMPRSDWSIVSSSQYALPTSFLEQQKIADFLSSIDDKIDLVANELSQAQTFKKGLLQQMFV